MSKVFSLILRIGEESHEVKYDFPLPPTNFEMIKAWHEKFAPKVIRGELGFPYKAEEELRLRLMLEELDELWQAMQVKSILDVADGIGDLLWVTYSCALAYGIDADAVVAEINKSNWSKLWPDGEPHYREDGKIIKPEVGYEPPNLQQVLGL